MKKLENHLLLGTNLGQIVVSSSVKCVDNPNVTSELNSFDFKAEIPDGMSVKKSTAILLAISGIAEIYELSFELKINSDCDGSPCSGEFLDAQEWSQSGKLLIVGTEDGAALTKRYPQLAYESASVVDYKANGLELRLRNLPELQNPTFHFIIAENQAPEPVKDSAWFAVEQSHNYVLRQA